MADYIRVMLRKCDEALAEIETLYRRDVASHILSDDLLYAIRAVVQDCQSALDATATRVKEKFLKKSSWKPYFPLGVDSADFRKKIEEQLKGLTAKDASVVAAFERHQTYQPGKKELGYLKPLANANKHSDFSEQTRTKVVSIKSQPGTSGVIANGGSSIRLGAGAEIRIGSGAQIRMGRGPGPTVVQNIQQTVLVGWNFVDPPVPVLPTLQSLVRLTRDAVEDIHVQAGL
jgi:hypothetical protein